MNKEEIMKQYCNEDCIYYDDNSCRGVKCKAKDKWKELQFKDDMQIENYKNLRKHFHNVTNEILGKGWYSMYYNIQDVDTDICNHIIDKFNDLKLKCTEYKYGCVLLLIAFVLSILILK